MLLPLLIAIVGLVAAEQDAKALRPCFERYSNNRLANVKPFHSEWRMRSEDSCLQFCSDTASRCRSIVYDSVQHICHFFMDNGFDVAVPAARMIYLRVTSKDCLFRSRSSSETNYIQSQETFEAPDAHAKSLMQAANLVTSEIPSRVEETHQMSTIQTAAYTETTTTETPQPATLLATTVTPAVFFTQKTFDKEDLHKNEVMRDLNTVEAADMRWQSSMEQLSKSTDDLAFKGDRELSTSIDFSSRDYTVTPLAEREYADLSKKLQRKIEQLQQMTPSRYTQYVEEKPKGSFPIVREETETAQPEVLRTPSIKKQKSRRAQFFAKRINFSDNIFARKTLEGADIRRQPERKPKVVTLSMPSSFLDKARYFLSSVNSKSEVRDGNVSTGQQVDNSATISSSIEGCSIGFLPVWLSFTNSVGSTLIDSSYAENFQACKSRCADETCTSLTYFADGQCMTNVENGGVHLRRPTREQRSARTDLKFCYPENISSYRGCTTFAGFRDYTLVGEPREVFDGLPPGYKGLKLCIELCVLSTHYKCRSVTYLTLEGTCSLNDRDSTTSPNRFERSDVVGQLYFENGCNTHASHEQYDIDFVSIQRATAKPKISLAKTLQEKPAKLKRRSITLKRHRQFRH